MNKISNSLTKNNDRVNEINERILDRQFPSQNLDILYKPRPQQTRFNIMPTVDTKHCIVNINNVSYDIKKTFNPGTTNGPWSGFVSKINDESILRNQVYTLQNNPQSKYIPSIKSELYNPTQINISKDNQPFPNLFKTYKYNSSNDNENDDDSEKTDYLLFNNFTRQQLKDT